jgi:hypothetical protein
MATLSLGASSTPRRQPTRVYTREITISSLTRLVLASKKYIYNLVLYTILKLKEKKIKKREEGKSLRKKSNNIERAK